jgi:hypothetical protein
MTKGSPGKRWTQSPCRKCKSMTSRRIDWALSDVVCPRCRIVAADIEGMLFEMLEFAPQKYKVELPGSVARIEAIKQAARLEGVGTTNGERRFIAESIARQPDLLRLCLKVAGQFKDLESQQRMADQENATQTLRIELRSRRLS